MYHKHELGFVNVFIHRLLFQNKCEIPNFTSRSSFQELIDHILPTKIMHRYIYEKLHELSDCLPNNGTVWSYLVVKLWKQ